MRYEDFWESPDNDNVPEYKPMPIWLCLFLGAVALYVIWACAAWGYEDGKEKHRERIMAARMEAMKEPLKFSLPEHYLEMTGDVERVDITKGAKQ